MIFFVFLHLLEHFYFYTERMASMKQRIFHQRITMAWKCVLVLNSFLVLYFFWIKMAILGLLFVMIVVGMLERLLHTTYTFLQIKSIELDTEMEFLVIDKGRFSTNKKIALRDIVRCMPMHTHFGLAHYLLIAYGAKKVLAIEPDDEKGFVEELTKRQKAEELSFASEEI